MADYTRKKNSNNKNNNKAKDLQHRQEVRHNVQWAAAAAVATNDSQLIS